MPQVSVIVLARNEEEHIGDCLKAVLAQESGFSCEVIVIESGSRDKTADIIRGYPVKMVQIPVSDFGHGKTRNLGIRLAQGEYLVFLNGDAVPVNPLWLQNLINSLRSCGAAGAYSRLYPPKDANPLDARDNLTDSYLFDKELKAFSSLGEGLANAEAKRKLVSFHTVSCAIRRDTLIKYPFADLAYAEDLEWSKRMMENGFSIKFEPASGAIHYHNTHNSLLNIVRRYFDDARFNQMVLKRWTVLGILRWIAVVIHASLDDIAYISRLRKRWSYRLRWTVYSPFARMAEMIGITLGVFPFLPPGLVNWLSLAEQAKRK